MTAHVARSPGAVIKNCEALPLAAIPVVPATDFQSEVVACCQAGARLSALIALPGGRQVLAVLSRDHRGELVLVRASLNERCGYPALSSELPQAQAFERALVEDHGIVPEGHPWLKPLRRHLDLESPATDAAIRAGVHEFFAVQGTAIHEVAVGPVHAGVIEPGHFRFQCRSEWVEHLEIQLGYQHRGVERLLVAAPPARRRMVAESIAGDTVIGHGWAYCAVIEALANVAAPPEAALLRAVALELERLANHVGDLGALCTDIGYLPGSAWLGRLRGEFLNALLELTGNRFGRGLLAPGGVRFGLPSADRQSFAERLERAALEAARVVTLALEAPSVMGRFEGTGRVSPQAARDLGLVGVAARACNVPRDVRRDHPAPPYADSPPPLFDGLRGDVLARACVRRDEAAWSARYVLDRLHALPEQACAAAPGTLRPNHLAVSLVEGWRGEIAHVALTDAAGEMAAYCVVDPSLHNWFGLALAVRDNLISDFPLCNKSFNLSYAGHDL